MVDARLCETCRVNEAKYTCPGCCIRSCSLDCVKRHKSGVDACDGVRKKSTYIALDQFTDNDFEKDYAFMSSAFDVVGSLARDKLKKITTKGENALKVPFHVSQLANANRIRGCRYLRLPPHFERSKSNTSRLNYKLNRIYWKVHWHFPHAEDALLIENEFDELTRLWDYLERVITRRSKVKIEDEEKDLINLHPFIQYEALGFGGIKALLKIEGIPKKSNCSRFEELDLKKTLRANLRDKTVTEHPIIYVVLNHHASSFTYKDSLDPSLWIKSLEASPRKRNTKQEPEPSFGLLTEDQNDAPDSDSEVPIKMEIKQPFGLFKGGQNESIDADYEMLVKQEIKQDPGQSFGFFTSGRNDSTDADSETPVKMEIPEQSFGLMKGAPNDSDSETPAKKAMVETVQTSGGLLGLVQYSDSE